MEFVFLPQLSFQSEEEKLEILNRGLQALKRGEIPQKTIALGKKYRKQIEGAVFLEAEIRFISDEVGKGVFSKNFVNQGTFIGEYTGIVRENRRVYFAPLNNYCYEYPILDRLGRSYVIDATSGNLARFINHSYCPNLKPVYAFIEGFYHCIFISLRDIQKGEQLCYNYGPNYWVLRGRPADLR